MTVLDNKPNIIVGDPRVCPDPTKRTFETRIAAMAFAAENEITNLRFINGGARPESFPIPR